jgi:hypothetical protein
MRQHDEPAPPANETGDWRGAPIKTDGAGNWVTAGELVDAEPNRTARRGMARDLERAWRRGRPVVDAYRRPR